MPAVRPHIVPTCIVRHEGFSVHRRCCAHVRGRVCQRCAQCCSLCSRGGACVCNMFMCNIPGGLYFENRVHLVTKQMRQMRHTLKHTLKHTLTTGMTINNSFALALIRTAEIGVSVFKGLHVRMISALAAAAAAGGEVTQW